MELKERIEELEGSLANLKVEIKGLLVELNELALRGKSPSDRMVRMKWRLPYHGRRKLVGSGCRNLAALHHPSERHTDVCHSSPKPSTPYT